MLGSCEPLVTFSSTDECVALYFYLKITLPVVLIH